MNLDAYLASWVEVNTIAQHRIRGGNASIYAAVHFLFHPLPMRSALLRNHVSTSPGTSENHALSSRYVDSLLGHRFIHASRINHLASAAHTFRRLYCLPWTRPKVCWFYESHRLTRRVIRAISALLPSDQAIRLVLRDKRQKTKVYFDEAPTQSPLGAMWYS